MYPPAFDDFEVWVYFRKKMNETFFVKEIVSNCMFKIINYVFIVLCCINGFYLLFTDNELVKIFDSIFIWLFFC